jgi:hypothetical protein
VIEESDVSLNCNLGTAVLSETSAFVDFDVSSASRETGASLLILLMT